MINKKELKKYYTSIKKNLSCSFNMKSVFIKELNGRVSNYLEENANSTMEKFIEDFGTPEEIAKTFDKDNDYYKRKARNRLIIEILLVIVLIITISISSYLIYAIINELGGDIVVTTK